MLRTHSLRGHGLFSSYAQPVPVVRVALEEPSVEGPNQDTGLSGGVLAGIVVGSVLGGVILIVLIGLLIRCLCQRRKISSNQEKPGTTSETKTASSSVWSCFRKRYVTSKGKRVPPPIFGSDKQDPDDISDTSFVLPELGGPNPHNKFDGMEWVDIRGLNDDTLQDISTDLRKYNTGQRR